MLPLPAQFAFSIQVIFLGKNLKYISEGKKDRKLDFIKLSPPCSGGGGLLFSLKIIHTELLKV